MKEIEDEGDDKEEDQNIIVVCCSLNCVALIGKTTCLHLKF